MKHRVKHSVEADGAIALELEVTGTHTGPMPTPKGTVAPTNAKVVWESCDYIRVRNGRIVSWHGYYDSVPFLTALGLMPKP
jgi:ketosteroid isomerase-like protein